MSVNVQHVVVDRGSDQLVDEAWALKEHIRETDGFLRQQRSFFYDAYRNATVHAYVTDEDALVGFAAVRRDGYILFLAVSPVFRGEDFGRRLVDDVRADHDVVSCHARTTNAEALAFYRHVGFEVKRRIDRYYEDGGDAYYLTLGDESLGNRLSRLIGR